MFRKLILPAVLGVALTAGGATALAHGHYGHHGQHYRHGEHGSKWGHHSRHLSAWDQEWLMMSIEGDRFEIAGGRLAQSKGQSDAVKDLGARLVADHSKSLEEAVRVAERLGVDVPDSPSPTQQWQLQVLHAFSGNAFDRQYASLEVNDHVQDIQEAEDEVKLGCNHKVRELAATEIPVLKEHLALAKAALASVGG